AVLIKPQFEAGRSNIGKNGIVKDRKVHISVLGDIISFCGLNGLSVKGLDYSPVSGGDGNIEYLAYITAEKNKTAAFDIANIVNTAFSELRKGRELK
ncbi:MAG: SAM-dependent methyltransferase, partial [Oscillospiraceae bacterium]